jgi:uncharacterized protein (TIGR03067 family)
VVVLVCTILLVAADKPKSDEAKKEKLQGTWKVVEAVKRGKGMPKDTVDGMQVIIAGKRLTLKDGDGKDVFEITVNPATKPPSIDMRLEDKELPILAIYNVDRETLKLKLCIDEKQVRPKDFAPEDRSCTLFILKRAK